MTQKLADFLAVFLGLRKTIMMFALLFLGIIFRLKGYIDGAQMVDLLKGTTIAFFAANSVEHVGETVRHYVDAKGQDQVAKDFNVGDGGQANG